MGTAASRGWSVITPAASLVRIATAPEITPTGLTEVEAARRLEARASFLAAAPAAPTRASSAPTRSTIPNGILLVFGVLTIAFASWRDALFLGILVANVVIGSFQEVRSKRALDRLAALVAPEAIGGARRGRPPRAGRAGRRRRPGAAVGRRPGRRRREDRVGRRARARRVQPDRRVRAGGARQPASRSGRAPSRSRATALFEATAVGPDSRAAQADRDGAGLPPPALAAGAGQRPAAALAGGAHASRSRSG